MRPKPPNKVTFLLLLILLLFPYLSFAAQFKVIRVYDGDTVKAQGHDIEIQIRLVGIDAPETSKKKREAGQPFSEQATKHLASLALSRMVDVKGYGLDRYNRILGVISVDGRDVNLEMVKAGYAEAYRGSPPCGFDPDPYARAELDARQAKRGMWVQGQKYISPKEWRKSMTR
jgi:endonuclease YncB( thermonuclease family)